MGALVKGIERDQPAVPPEINYLIYYSVIIIIFILLYYYCVLFVV